MGRVELPFDVTVTAWAAACVANPSTKTAVTPHLYIIRVYLPGPAGRGNVTAVSAADHQSSNFDAYYFAHCCGRPYGRDPEWLDFFATIAERIAVDFAPTSVLDAGCAWGLLVEALRARGIQADGIDISEYAISQVHPDTAPFCRTGSIVEPFGTRYDLIVTMEVVEHMTPSDADRAISNLTNHTDRILFSSSPFDLREPTHQSVRPSEGWAEAFARHGFFRDVDYDAGYVTPWAVLYQRESLTVPALVRRYERWGFARDHAARESRAQALETQKKLDRLDFLEAKATELVAAIQTATLERDDAAFERQKTLEQLGHAHATIRGMESSLFWRLRTPWAKLSRLIRGR